MECTLPGSPVADGWHCGSTVARSETASGGGMSQCVVGLPAAEAEQKIHQEQGNWHGGVSLGTRPQQGLRWGVIRLGQDSNFKPSHVSNG